MLKIWNHPLLNKPIKAHKYFRKQPTPEKHPLGDLRYPSRLYAAPEVNTPKYSLKLHKNLQMARDGPLLDLKA